MIMTLSSLVPDADDLLALDVEELAGVLLTHLNSYGAGSGSAAVQHDRISGHNFFMNPFSEYLPARHTEIRRALMEAWGWLQGAGLLVRDPEQSADWFFVSRRAKQLKSRADFTAYREASLLTKRRLHPLIATKVYPAFLRGEYDTAVFQAFREVEVAVRRAGNLPDDLVGRELMREAFRPANPNKASITPGPLTDTTLPAAEQEGMASLFVGAIGLYKNPQSHRNVPTDAVDAAEVIVFASHLLRMVDRLAPQSPEVT